jgi:hypothetical protein
MIMHQHRHTGYILALSLLLTGALVVLVYLFNDTPDGHAAASTSQSGITTTETTILYDGALGGTPDTQGLIFFPPTAGEQSATGGATTLTTTSSLDVQVGYIGGTTVPTLDRTSGYTLSFTTQVLSETHVSDDRAGFSIIVLGNDLEGIELGFWRDSIWAQEYDATDLDAQFIRAETSAFTTTTGLTDYELVVRDDRYTLLSDTTTILSGTLRNYSSFGLPYNQQNFLFLGDNTTSAAAIIRLARVAITVETDNGSNPPFRVMLPLIVLPETP